MGEAGDDNKLQVTEFVTVSELANLMDVSRRCDQQAYEPRHYGVYQPAP